MSFSRFRPLLILVAVLLTAAACGASDTTDAAATDADAVDDPAERADAESATGEPAETDATDKATDDATDGDDSASTEGLDIGLFMDGALATNVTTEDCTLNGGAETSCYRITVAGHPVSHDVGPFCPTSIDDDADAGGIWFDGDEVYDIDGQFILDLPEIYGDDRWQLYDEDGNVLVTDTEEAFDGAARPNVDEEYQNHCVEGRLEWLDGGQPVTSTVLIPVTPVPGSASATSGTQGVTLDGVVIAESAPVSAILGAYTIAAFDDCGGHFNPFEGYHMHGAVGCSEAGVASEGETPIFGFAMDGYPVHSPLDADDLDQCNGHTTDAGGYHYHANSAEKNQVIACLMGQFVAAGGR